MSQLQAPTPLRESIAMLAGLRKEVESQLDTVDWASQSHADTEVLAFMQLAIGNVAAIETLAKTDAAGADDVAVADVGTARATIVDPEVNLAAGAGVLDLCGSRIMSNLVPRSWAERVSSAIREFRAVPRFVHL